MKKLFALLGVGLMASLVCSCNNDDNEVVPGLENVENGKDAEEETGEEEFKYVYREAKAIELTDSQKEVSHSLSAFGWDVLKELLPEAKEGDNKSLLISPLSIYTELAMLANGVEGETRGDLLTTMRLRADHLQLLNDYMATVNEGIKEADPATKFQSVNSLWYNKCLQLEPTFGNALGNHYAAELYPVTFDNKTVDAINDWCARATYQRIPKIMEELDPSVMAVLLNAVYFRSNWKSEFDADKTRLDWFTQDDGQRVKINMMENNVPEASLYEGKGYQTLCLPFNNLAYAMQLILPNEGVSPTDLLEGAMQDASQSVQRFRWNARVHVKMPKMTAECRFDLSDVVKGMGAQKLFVPSSDFVMFDGATIGVNKIVHNTYVSIDEDGVEAAAITGSEWVTALPGEKEEYTDFIVNRPFLYTIIEISTGCPLFVGYYGGK